MGASRAWRLQLVLIELIVPQLETNIATYTIDNISMHICSVASAAAEPGN